MKRYSIVVKAIDGVTSTFIISSIKSHSEILEELSPVTDKSGVSWIGISTDNCSVKFNTTHIISISVGGR